MLEDDVPYVIEEDYRYPNLLQDLKQAALNGLPIIITVRAFISMRAFLQGSRT